MIDEIAAGTNRRFEHVVETTAPREAIWERWTTPATWGEWDQGLKTATIDGDFIEGATGAITPLKGPKSSFVVSSLIAGASCTFATSMPGATLHVQRDFIESDTTTFRHTVWFDGPMAWLWSRLYGKKFRRALPPTMRGLAVAAEATR